MKVGGKKESHFDNTCHAKNLKKEVNVKMNTISESKKEILILDCGSDKMINYWIKIKVKK